MRGSIVVVGSINMDLVVLAPRHPRVGETLTGRHFHTFPGGKGANQAVAAARLSAEVKMIGCVGKDAFGESLLQTIASEGVDTTHVSQDPHAPTGVALITVDDEGRNTIVVIPGANGRVGEEDVAQAENAFEGASVLLVQLECPLAAVAKAIELARRHNVRVILNPAPAQPVPRDLLERVDYLIPNESELFLLTELDEPYAAINRLREWGVRRVIATLGENGALVADGNSPIVLPAHRVAVVDTTGAGDAFVAAFAVAITEGRSTTDAARWANAAGALAVTRAGAQTSLPTHAEVDALLQSL